MLRLPAYFWAALTVTALVGVAIGAVLFSAEFTARVVITPATPNLTVSDRDAGVILATNLQPNLAVMNFGTVAAGNVAGRTIVITNTGGNTEPTFYLRVPGSLETTMVNGAPLPDGITLFLSFYNSCGDYTGAVFDSTTQVCSIPFPPGRQNNFPLYLNIPNTATAQDLTIKVTITTFDTQF